MLFCMKMGKLSIKMEKTLRSALGLKPNFNTFLIFILILIYVIFNVNFELLVNVR